MDGEHSQDGGVLGDVEDGSADFGHTVFGRKRRRELAERGSITVTGQFGDNQQGPLNPGPKPSELVGGDPRRASGYVSARIAGTELHPQRAGARGWPAPERRDGEQPRASLDGACPTGEAVGVASAPSPRQA